jgi:hypothetical protein
MFAVETLKAATCFGFLLSRRKLYKILEEGVMYNSASKVAQDSDLRIYAFNVSNNVFTLQCISASC